MRFSVLEMSMPVDAAARAAVAGFNELFETYRGFAGLRIVCHAQCPCFEVLAGQLAWGPLASAFQPSSQSGRIGLSKRSATLSKRAYSRVVTASLPPTVLK